MSKYLDGYVIPLKKENLKEYKKMARLGKKVWMKHGALDYYECAGDDLNNGFGLTFPKMCKLKPDETVIFAFIIYKNKTHRNAVNKKVHKEFSEMDFSNFKMPFEMKRYSMGGVKTLVH